MKTIALALGVLCLATPAFAVGPNSPAPVGSGYTSWSTRGGATLETGDGARAGFSAGGGGFYGGLGNFTLEGQYIWHFSPDLDFGLGGRVPLWPFGLAPGIQVRPRLLNRGAFQLALDIGAYLPMYFAGYYYYYGPGPFVGTTLSTFNIGLSVEPGVMMSYFVRDCMEIYFGVITPIGLNFYPFFGANFGLVHRVGFAFNFKKQHMGIYANIDFGPRFFLPYVWFWGALQAGVQFRIGS